MPDRSISLETADRQRLSARLGRIADARGASLENRILLGDGLELCKALPDHSIPLIFADPPYEGIRKKYGPSNHYPGEGKEYLRWFSSYLDEFQRLLTPEGSLYICADWRSSGSLQGELEKRFVLRNRISWEREKGRGSRQNWKNNLEDIWFCTASDKFYFNVDAAMSYRRVKAPYRQEGKPKDWDQTGDGGWRKTYPSNIWTDLTVPFWSMKENTAHPTQKPEKLLARIILASSKPGDLVFDPFMGSGTTAVCAQKLGRSYCGAEIEEDFALLALKRLELASLNREIQGTLRTDQGLLFLERNSRPPAAKKNSSVNGED